MDNGDIGQLAGWLVTGLAVGAAQSHPIPSRSSPDPGEPGGTSEDQGPTRATRMLLWLLSIRPDVATVEAATAEPSQAYLEQCFRQVSAGR